MSTSDTLQLQITLHRPTFKMLMDRWDRVNHGLKNTTIKLPTM